MPTVNLLLLGLQQVFEFIFAVSIFSSHECTQQNATWGSHMGLVDHSAHKSLDLFLPTSVTY